MRCLLYRVVHTSKALTALYRLTAALRVWLLHDILSCVCMCVSVCLCLLLMIRCSCAWLLVRAVTQSSTTLLGFYYLLSSISVWKAGGIIQEAQGIIPTLFCILSLGLNPTEAAKLNNYLHFSEPKYLKKKSILEMADLNPTIDFLDPLSEDIPKGENATCTH